MRILFALETCADPRYAERRKMVESTWAKRMPPGYTFESFEGPRLGVDDSYKGLCQKSRAIYRYARENGFDWTVKVDDDVFVRTDQLKIPDSEYCGFCLPRPPEVQSYCAGSFYWLSRRTFSILADAPMDSRWTSAEDQWAGWNLAQHGIHPVKLPGVVLEPCPCGRCTPDCVPAEWVSYCMWIRFSPDLFNTFEQRYRFRANPYTA